MRKSQIHKIIVSSQRKKLWDLAKGLIYMLSLGIMVFLGYIKEDDNVYSNRDTKEQITLEKNQNQNNDSIYYAFSPLFDEFSLSQN